jgi:hypothetical protein
MNTKKFSLMILATAVLLLSCASPKQPTNSQKETASTQVVLVVPSAQIISLIDAYIASTAERRPELLEAKKLDQIKECVQRAAINLASSIVQTFSTQDLANSVVMQQIQQNLEQFIAQCSIK